MKSFESIFKDEVIRYLLDRYSLRGGNNVLKLIFQIPNLFRKPNDHLPHGSYRNRGGCKRFLKIIEDKKFSRINNGQQ